VSFKFWDGEGRVVWAENKALVGQVFGLSDDLPPRVEGRGRRLRSTTCARRRTAPRRRSGLPLLEIYSPIREVWSVA
jgi:hypothetical protein